MTGAEMVEEMKEASLRIQQLLEVQNDLERQLDEVRAESKVFGGQLEKFSKNIARISEKAPEGRVTLVFTGKNIPIFLSFLRRKNERKKGTVVTNSPRKGGK